MSNKQAALKAAKASRRKAAAKQKSAQATKQKTVQGRTGSNADTRKFLATKEGVEHLNSLGLRAGVSLKEYRKKVTGSDPKVLENLANMGFTETVDQARKTNKTVKTDVPTNTTVMEGINNQAGILVAVHSVMEIYERLANEGRFPVTPDHQKIIDEADKSIIRQCEDIRSMVTLIDAGKVPEDYQDLLIDHMRTVSEFAHHHYPTVMEMVKEQQHLVDQYVAEHRCELSMSDYAETLHGTRVDRIAERYMTPVTTSPAPLYGTQEVDPL